MERKTYRVPMEIIIEVSQLFKKAGIKAELDGANAEYGCVHLTIHTDPKSAEQQKFMDFIKYMVEVFVDYRYSWENDDEYYKKEAA